MPIATGQATETVRWTRPDPDWHPIAVQWYRSLSRSGQAEFFEPSDVAHAYLVAETIHRYLSADRVSGQLFASILSASAELLVTEGARRRLKIELARAESADSDEIAAVAALADYQRDLA